MTHDPRFLDLLKILWRGAPYGLFWTPDGEEKVKEDGSTFIASQTLWTPAERPTRLPDVWAKRLNVYFGVNPSAVRYGEHKKTSNEDIGAINCLYAEFDAKDYGGERGAMDEHIRALPHRPSAVIMSGGGFHCYTLLDQPFIISTDEDRTRAAKVQRAWVHEVGGDHAAVDLARVLRVPDTLNHKYEPARRVDIIEFDLERVYKFEDLEASVNQRIEQLETAQSSVVHTSTGASLAFDDQELLAKMFAEGYKWERLWSGDWGGYPSQSEADYALLTKLSFYFGPSLDRVIRMFEQCGLYREDKGRRYLERTAKNALATVTSFYDSHYNSNGAKEAVEAVERMIELKPKKTREEPAAHTNGKVKTETIVSHSPQNLMTFEHSDAGNGEAIQYLFSDTLMYTKSHGWLGYTGTHWSTENGDKIAYGAAITTLRERIKAAWRDDMAANEKLIKFCLPNKGRWEAALSAASKLLMTSIDDFDNDPDLLNCQNGVVDLRTGKLISHHPSQRFSYVVPVEYDPNADYTGWVNVLSSNVSAGDLEYLRLATGYSLTGLTREEVFFYIWGPPRSGKGTFTETLGLVLGRDLARELSFKTLVDRPSGDVQNFQLAPLKNCRVVFASESKHNERLDEAKVKVMTGGNKIECAFKYGDPFNYRPQYKIWLSSNPEPNAEPTDDAVWGRMRVIHFPNSRLGSEDKTLKESLRTPEALRAVLAWAVSGAVDYYKLGPQGLPESENMREYKQSRREKLDNTGNWFKECIEEAPGNTALHSAIYLSYIEWCRDNGVKPKGRNKFSDDLEDRGCKKTRITAGTAWLDIAVR
jgi:putative DNA primase/helicase